MVGYASKIERWVIIAFRFVGVICRDFIAEYFSCESCHVSKPKEYKDENGTFKIPAEGADDELVKLRSWVKNQKMVSNSALRVTFYAH